MSLAVKRSIDTSGHDVIKRPALSSVSPDTLQVCLPTFMYAAFMILLCAISVGAVIYAFV